MVDRRHYDALPSARGPYIHAVRHGGTLYVSGLTALDTAAQGGDLGAQTRAILGQFKEILAAERRTPADIIKLTIFVTGLDDLAILREELVRFYAGHLPACSLVQVAGLIHPDLVVEIEGIIAL